MPPPQTGFLDRTLTIHGHTYPYVVYVPRDYDRARKWPVILFLHGAGERGSDGLKQTQIGVGAAIRARPDRVHAIAVFPQVPTDQRWLGEPADAAIEALDRAMREFNGDPDRVVLTGLSMGGYGTWHLALAHPRRFAALAVVCGGLLPHETTSSVQRSPLTAQADDPYAFTAQSLRHLPIRIFHGADDPVVPVDESRRMHEALRAVDADVRYTEYPATGHNSWTPAYGDEELWTWMMASRLR